MASGMPQVEPDVLSVPDADVVWQDIDLELRLEPVKTRIHLNNIAAMLPVVRVLAVRDFKAKFKQSLLGPVWIFLQPLALLAAFLVGFHAVATIKTSGVPYVVFVLVALGAWTYFQASLSMGAVSVVTNAQLMQRTACPRLAFPIAALIANLPSLAVPLVAGVAAAAITGELSPRVLLLPLGLLWLIAATAGVVAMTSALNVRYRDLLAVLPLILQVGVFFSPIGYQVSDLPSWARIVIGLNPLAGVMETWRWMVLPIHPPSVGLIATSLAVTIVLVLAGWFVFTRSEPTMADVV
jgi:ABC-type polysaccharide/polyol phosphate export permease